MTRGHWLVVGLSALLLIVASSAYANSPWVYRPIVIDGGPTNAQTAYVLDNPANASIAYHKVRPEAPALWLQFAGEYGDKITFHMGVPKIEGYGLVRPVAALIGPGLPEPERELPFALPAGCGATFYDTKEQDIENFTEKYLGVESWRFSPITVMLPATGTYYLVSYLPDDPAGKLWIAVGEHQNFRLSDLWTVPRDAGKIKRFFEVDTPDGNGFWATALTLFLGIFITIIAVSPG